MMKGQMVEQMRAVCSQVKELNLQLPEEARLWFVKSTSVVEACRSLGSVIDCSQVKCKRMRATGNKTSFDLCSTSLNSPLSSELISCQLSPVADPSIVFKSVVQPVATNSFDVRYPSHTTGLHQLSVQVGGADILDTPLIVEVIPRKGKQIFRSQFYPRGLAISQEGHLIVAVEGEHCITIIDPNSGNKIRSFGQHGVSKPARFNNPKGVALSQDGHIILADFFNHRLLVLTVDGGFVSAVGSKGSQPLHFKYPWDVAVHHDGKLFVTDRGNGRVQVLNSDLTYSHSFGRLGSCSGDFNNPQGIALDSAGMIYVADLCNNRVQKFTPEGEMLAVIDSKEDGSSQLNGPIGLCVDSNDILYVAESSSNTVCAFNTSGQFLGYVGSSDGSSFRNPYFIASDQFGRLYISDDHSVFIY